jgi:8-oxo-dGTP pyrophosphatase MutT (NUDIX family)
MDTKLRHSKRKSQRKSKYDGADIINATGVLISTRRKDTRILFVIEKKKVDNLNLVGTPGGKINKRETPWDAFKREFGEEISSPVPDISQDTTGNVASFVYGNTKIYYGEINDSITFVKNNETQGIILPRLQHVVDVITNNPDDRINITTSTFFNDKRKSTDSKTYKTYRMRRCVAESLRAMIDKGIFNKYVTRSSSACIIL